MLLDPIDKLQIDFNALQLAHDENPDHDGPLCDVLTDDHTRRALADYFGECEDYSDDLLPALLAAYKETQAVEDVARLMSWSLMASLSGTEDE